MMRLKKLRRSRLAETLVSRAESAIYGRILYKSGICVARAFFGRGDFYDSDHGLFEHLLMQEDVTLATDCRI